jgi:hypothetical protein
VESGCQSSAGRFNRCHSASTELHSLHEIHSSGYVHLKVVLIGRLVQGMPSITTNDSVSRVPISILSTWRVPPAS